MYDFDAVGNLTVSGDVGSAMIFDSGEHNYQIAKSDGADETVGLYVLTLADKHYAVKLSSTDLLIEMNPIDPLALYESKLTAHFVRIE